MKNYLLPKNGSFYKANLHSHSTLSDGKWTVEEIKKQYKAMGYSIVAYTDHQVFIPHNDLADEDFLPLNGYEIDIPEDKAWGRDAKTCHFCLIASDPDRTVQKIYHDSIYIDKNADKVELAKDRAPIVRRYDTDFISSLMKDAREDGFFVTYNHPVWSLEAMDECFRYSGMHAMEIVNYGSYVTGHEERNSALYDLMLHKGKDIFCIAADDNHNVFPTDHPRCDSFGGFTVIKAERLEYKAVMKALFDGHFYASEGPEILELYLDTEDGKIHIKTTEAVRILMTTGDRYNKVETPSLEGEAVTEAAFEISHLKDGYVRFTVRDREGKEAYTHAYKISRITAL